MRPVSIPAATGRAALEDLLSWRIAVAGRLIRSAADLALADHNIGAQALGTLLRLVEEDGLSQADLARRQRVEPASVCRMVDRLSRDGLVERTADPADRRSTRVVLTPAGRELAAMAGASTRRLEERVASSLTLEERDELARLLDKVLAAVSAGEGPA
jgi:MarR family transcriptional regulator, transcriptional regulator for hemolysin